LQVEPGAVVKPLDVHLTAVELRTQIRSRNVSGWTWHAPPVRQNMHT
jgi:hypothetical protein